MVYINGVHSLFLYEVYDAPKAMTVINKHLSSVFPFQQPRKQMRATHVWKTISMVTLWILWNIVVKDDMIPYMYWWNYGRAYWR